MLIACQVRHKLINTEIANIRVARSYSWKIKYNSILLVIKVGEQLKRSSDNSTCMRKLASEDELRTCLNV